MALSPDDVNNLNAKLDGLIAGAKSVGQRLAPDITHRDGVPWHKAPLPRRWHRCRPQSWGTLSTGNFWERCACGAIRNGEGRPWIDRNSRKETTR